MSFLTQAQLAKDPAIQQRVTACAALEGIPDPQFWVNERGWKFSAQEGWSDAYAASSLNAPGEDEDAITDAMIVDAVRSIRAAELQPPDPDPNDSSPAE